MRAAGGWADWAYKDLLNILSCLKTLDTKQKIRPVLATKTFTWCPIKYSLAQVSSILGHFVFSHSMCGHNIQIMSLPNVVLGHH